MVRQVANMGEERSTLQEHHDWAQTLWNRMDRDKSGTITREELDCEEFRDVLRQVIAPNALATTTNSGVEKSGNAGYTRVQQNVEQAVDFCLRKADFNHDMSLTFQEFKSFLMVLRSKQDATQTANLIFALFDLDGDARISQTEFREIYRYYLGHHPPIEDFIAEWRRLDARGNDEVTREDYIRWLQTSKNPIFKQHAPPIRGFSTDSASTLKTLESKKTYDKKKSSSSIVAKALEDSQYKRAPPQRPRWNQNFNTEKNGNHEMPAIQRTYFSRPQSLPELSRYYNLHRGFETNSDRLRNTCDVRRHKGILSTDGVPSMIRERDVPGGTMRHPLSGRVVPWTDHWIEPKSMKKKVAPVTLLFSLDIKGGMASFDLSEEKPE